MSNDDNEKTGTEAGTEFIRFMLGMIKCYIQCPIFAAEKGRGMISNNLNSSMQAGRGKERVACITRTHTGTV